MKRDAEVSIHIFLDHPASFREDLWRFAFVRLAEPPKPPL